MSVQEIIMMAVLSIAAAAVLLLKIEHIETKENQRENKLFIKKARKKQTLKLYRFLAGFWLTKRYTNRIYQRYELFYPSLEDVKAEKTVYAVCGLLGINSLLFLLLFLMRPAVVNFLSALLVIFVAQACMLSLLLRKAEIKMLLLLDEKLSDIKHVYISCKDIATAVWLAMEKGGREISAHMEEILAVLESCDTGRAVREYNESQRNKYFKLLLGICVKTAEQGDSFDEKGHSIFSENISILKRDIRREIHKIRKTDFIFSGFSFVSTVPILGLSPIRAWAVANLIDLEKFYAGKLGFFVSVMSFLITAFTFRLLELLRNPEDAKQKDYRAFDQLSRMRFIKKLLGSIGRNPEKRRKRKALLKRTGDPQTVQILALRQLLYGAAGLLFGILLFLSAAGIERHRILSSVYELHKELPERVKREIKVEDLQLWMQSHQKYGSAVFDGTEHPQRSDAAKNIAPQDIEAIQEGILDRFAQAGRQYFKWYEMLSALCISYLAYQIPYLLLFIKKKFMEDSMAEEVMRFQTILSMQVFLKGTSLMDLLESMELFARVFKPSIQACINNIAYDEKKALQELKDSEDFPPFQRLVDSFIMHDQAGTRIAFDEVVEDIKHSQDIFEFDIAVMLEKKSSMAEVLAFIPGIFILVFYLVIPFTAAGMLLFETSFQDNMHTSAYYMWGQKMDIIC